MPARRGAWLVLLVLLAVLALGAAGVWLGWEPMSMPGRALGMS